MDVISSDTFHNPICKVDIWRKQANTSIRSSVRKLQLIGVNTDISRKVRRSSEM